MSSPSNVPHVSVLMRVYNAERYLREAIDSVLAQSYRDFELVIIDDGSTDRSAAIIASYDDSRIRAIAQRNGGYLAAAVRGLTEARGTFVAVLDADDRALPGRLFAQVEAFANDPEMVLVASTVRIVDAAGTVVGERRFPLSDAAIRRSLPLYNCVCHSAAMFHRQTAIDAGGYSTEVIVEDYDLWLRLLKRGKARTLQEAFVDYRIKSGPLNASHLKFVLRRTLAIRAAAFSRYGYARSVQTRIVDVAMSLLIGLPAPLIDRVFRLVFYRRRQPA